MTLLAREQLRDLNTLKPSIAVRDTLIHWAVIIAAWTAVAWQPAWWTAGLAVVVVGTQYYGLHIIGHDGIHRRLFESKVRNDLWNDLFIVGPICAITRINRFNHIEHHRVTCLPNDPDRHKYVHADKETRFSFLFFLSGLQNMWPTFANIYLRKRKPTGTPSEGGTPSTSTYSARDLAIIFGWQTVLIGGLSYAIGWWAYPVLWLLPVYLFAYRADLVRVFCEHSMQVTDREADERKRMITYTSNWLERQFFAPHNMNFHTAHHLWPSIPYYNLPKADCLIREWLATHGPDENLTWRRSYLRYILSYWMWQRGLPNPAHALL